MLDTLGERQKALLQLLLKTKAGLSVDELSARLQITRNAVRQHLAALERDGLVAAGETRPSGGRPQRLYVLTDKAKEFFPRQYSWFAELLVDSIEKESGAGGLRERLRTMGSAVAQKLLERNPGLKNRQEKVRKLSEVMQDIGYGCDSDTAGEDALVIEADNCVFHSLAMKNPDVCQFDLALLSTFTGSKVDHQECMAKGGAVCRFKFKPR